MKALLAVLQLLPLIVSTVRALDDALPVAGKGKDKLDLILGVTDVVCETAPELTKDIPKDKLVALIAGTVARTVTMFNAAGAFSK